MRSRRSGRTHRIGEKQNQRFQLSFNASLKVDFQGSRVTSDGGLILVRELDERLGLEKLIEEYFVCASFKDSFEKLPSRTLFGPNRISLR